MVFMGLCKQEGVIFAMIAPYVLSSELMTTLNIDLHTHSCISDGVLTPSQLVTRAAERGVDVLALTDHDDVSGLAQAVEAAHASGLQLISGVEISVTWQSQTLHVVGLRIDSPSAELMAGLAGLRAGRKDRAVRIAAQLQRFGIHDSLAGAWQQTGNPELIGRLHFARFLVASGVCKDVHSVFKRYLSKGKPGYVAHEWATLDEAVGWIRASGGQAVLAHPGRYELGSGKMASLLGLFSELGGAGIEVVTGSHTPDQYLRFARLAQQFKLLGSRGSDFHTPEDSYRDVGRLPQLPAGCTPIWHDWALN